MVSVSQTFQGGRDAVLRYPQYQHSLHVDHAVASRMARSSRWVVSGVLMRLATKPVVYR